jgi:hypothetical protein
MHAISIQKCICFVFLGLNGKFIFIFRKIQWVENSQNCCLFTANSAMSCTSGEKKKEAGQKCEDLEKARFWFREFITMHIRLWREDAIPDRVQPRGEQGRQVDDLLNYCRSRKGKTMSNPRERCKRSPEKLSPKTGLISFFKEVISLWLLWARIDGYHFSARSKHTNHLS